MTTAEPPQTQPSTASTAQPTTQDTETILTVTPSIKPLLAWLAILLGVGVTLLLGISTNKQMFGSVEIAEIAANIVILLLGIGTLKLLIEMYILTRTQYVVTTSGVRREYTLFYRKWSRELPLSMIRGHELTRSRIETLFGVGTVAFLSGSLAGSIGHLKFSAAPNPDELRSAVQDQVLTISPTNADEPAQK